MIRARELMTHGGRSDSTNDAGANWKKSLHSLSEAGRAGGVSGLRSPLRDLRGGRGVSARLDSRREAGDERQPLSEFLNLRVAVVHDWLTGMRGGEKVLEAILELVPGADLYTLFHFEGSVSSAIERHAIRTSFLQRVARFGDYRRLLPLYPGAIRSFDLTSYDLVISSSHAVAAGVRHGSARHVVYCHTPMRYIWDRFDDYFPSTRPFIRFAASSLAPILRKWDVARASEAGIYVANSSFVADRIRRFYGRDASVIHPFVDDRFLEATLATNRGSYHVVVSALVPYKRVSDAIEAAKLSGRRLIVIGDGPLLEQYRASAPPNVELRGWAGQDDLIKVVSEARSLIMPGVEDFGITALEALALGTPVISVSEGGAKEAIGPDGGVLYQGGVEGLVKALEEVEAKAWDRSRLRQRAALFSRQAFRQQFSAVIEELLVASSQQLAPRIHAT